MRALAPPTCAALPARPARRAAPAARALPLALAPLLLLLSAAPAHADPVAVLNPPELFARTCGGCHAGGGNVLGGPSLRAPDLAAHGMGPGPEQQAALEKMIGLGKNKMPGYGEACAPKGACTFGARLSGETVALLAQYVADQAAAGWPQ